jgi:hypothetical protein
MTADERTLLKMIASLVAELYDEKAEKQGTTSNDADEIRRLLKAISEG